jgi:hypothetical protein
MKVCTIPICLLEGWTINCARCKYRRERLEVNMPEEKKTDKNVKCEDCRYSVGVDTNESRFVCENPNLKTFGKNVKHGHRFACGYGVMWNAEQGDKNAG